MGMGYLFSTWMLMSFGGSSVSKLEDLLKEEKSKKSKVLVQAYLDRDLVSKIEKLRKKNDVSWSGLIGALFIKTIKEEKL
jgi:hypothetical protein